jgi:multimeric flavodoxin WrbA
LRHPSCIRSRPPQAQRSSPLSTQRTNVLVLFYSTYGHLWKMAVAVAEGARAVPGANVTIKRVAETLPDEVLGKMNAKEAQRT